MRHALKMHPDSRCEAVTAVEVEVARSGDRGLAVLYQLAGAIGDIRLPPVSNPVRTDGLWQHTCFEAFVRIAADPEYHELNFAPSAAWAAYRFSGYRSGMAAADIGPPRIETRSFKGCYELLATLELPDLLTAASFQLGLSAVIEETEGRKSYWALAHPPGKADFHHADGFALTLSGPEK